MKLLIINQHKQDALGGSEIQCDLIATYMTKFGHDVTYYAVNGSQNEYDTVYRVIPNLLNQKALTEIVDEFQPDVVYWRYNKNKFLRSAITLRRLNVNIVFGVSHVSDVTKWRTYNNYNVKSLKGIVRTIYGAVTTPLRSRINHFGYHFIDGVTSLNSDYLSEVSVSPKKTIKNSMETDAEDFHWSNDFVFWVANLKPKKNPEKFIQLADDLSNSNIDFLMVGHIQSDNYEYIRDESNTPQNFYYLGPKTPKEVNSILQESLFLIHTCEPEGFGNNFIQAWLQGKPTISLYFDPDGFIKDKELGYVSGNDEQLIKDTKKLIDDKDMRQNMGENAQSFAQENFAPENNVREYERFFEEVIEKGD